MTKINTHANGLPSGLYVLRTSKEEIRARIEAIPSRFVDVVGNRQIVNTYKTTRRKVIALLEDCFEDTCARNKCLKEVKRIDTDDISLANYYWRSMCDIIFRISESLQYFVPFDDMPSCRSLLDFSVEDATVKAIDLVGTGVVKEVAKALSIGSEICKIKTIADVEHFYSSAQGLLAKETREGWQPTPLEFLFENKCEMELEYCKLASLKVAGQLTKEVMESSMIILEKCKGILNENRSEYRCD